MTKILIDHREDKKLIKELIKRKLEVEIKQLPSADIILKTKNKDNKIETVGIEIKKQNDFLNSIIDKRLHLQLTNLKENFSIPILIIEGNENIYEVRNFHPNSIRGMLASIAIDYQIPTIYTKNHRDTASFIHVIAKRLEKPIRDISLLKKKKPLSPKELQEYIIESLPGIGPSVAKLLLKEFKTIKNIMLASEEDLKKIPKIGDIKAERIIQILNQVYKS
jgi:Fanconi anemia group M protein